MREENLGYEAPLAKFDYEEEDEDDNNKNFNKNAEKNEIKFSEAYMRALNFCEANPFMNNIELKNQEDEDKNMIDENNNNENQANLNFMTKDKIDVTNKGRNKLGSDEWLEACLESSDLNGLRKAINSLFIHNNMQSLKYAMPPCCRDVISYNNNVVSENTNQYTNEMNQDKANITNNDFNEIDTYYNNIKNKFKKIYKIEENSTNALIDENNDNDTSKLTKDKYNTTGNKHQNDYENTVELIDANNNKITGCEDFSNSLSFQSKSCIDDSLEDIFDFNENFDCEKSKVSIEQKQKLYTKDIEKMNATNVPEKNGNCTKTPTVQTNARLDNFCECLSRSLEDLVNTFDERITSSLRNFQQKVETFAPVQNKENKNHAQTFQEKDFAPMSTIQDSAYFSDGDGLRADNLVDSDEEDNEYNREKYRDDHSNITYLHSKNNKSKSSKKCKRIKVYKYDEKYDQVNDDKDEESYSDDNSCLSTSSCSSDEYDDSSCCYEQEFIDRDIAMIRMGEDDADDYTPSAEQVICEIEEIFKENFSTTDPIYVNTNPWLNNNNRGELDVDSMTSSEVASMCEGLEINTSILSDELVRELNMRDELEYEKETRNRFIYLLLLIQQKKKEKLLDPSRIENKNKNDKSINNHFSFDVMDMSSTSISSLDNNELTNTKNNNLKYYKEAAMSKLRGFSDKIAHKKSYLSTVIPYSDDLASPSLDILIIYNQILQAIAENSSNSLALLTDYILKVLCPKA